MARKCWFVRESFFIWIDFDHYSKSEKKEEKEKKMNKQNLMKKKKRKVEICL